MRRARPAEAAPYTARLLFSRRGRLSVISGAYEVFIFRVVKSWGISPISHPVPMASKADDLIFASPHDCRKHRERVATGNINASMGQLVEKVLPGKRAAFLCDDLNGTVDHSLSSRTTSRRIIADSFGRFSGGDRLGALSSDLLWNLANDGRKFSVHLNEGVDPLNFLQQRVALGKGVAIGRV